MTEAERTFNETMNHALTAARTEVLGGPWMTKFIELLEPAVRELAAREGLSPAERKGLAFDLSLATARRMYAEAGVPTHG